MDRLLEREEALGSLAAALDAARSDSGRMVLIRGEAGIGKTSLLRAVRETGSLPFYLGRCEPLSVPEPLGPVRELAEAVGVGESPELATGERRALARVLRSALTAQGPAVAAIEDAHWADPATLDVVRILARRIEEAPLALLLTLRDDELAANPALARLVGDLATDPSVSRIALAPLSMQAVRTMAAPAGADAREVARVTGGNPFLVVEMLAAVDGLPASVRDATLARVSRLSSEARGLVDLAAVVGERVPAALLDVLAPGQAPAIEEALARGVLTDDARPSGFGTSSSGGRSRRPCPRRDARRSTPRSPRRSPAALSPITPGSPTTRTSPDWANSPPSTRRSRRRRRSGSARCTRPDSSSSGRCVWATPTEPRASIC